MYTLCTTKPYNYIYRGFGRAHCHHFIQQKKEHRAPSGRKCSYVHAHNNTYVTGPEKTGLIYTKYIYSYYGTYLLFFECYPISVSCIEFLRILCIYDEICVKML